MSKFRNFLEVQNPMDPYGMYGRASKMSQQEFDKSCLEKLNAKAIEISSAVSNNMLQATVSQGGISQIPADVLVGRGIRGTALSQQELKRLMELGAVSQQGNNFNINTNILKTLYSTATKVQNLKSSAKNLTGAIMSAPKDVAMGVWNKVKPNQVQPQYWQNSLY